MTIPRTSAAPAQALPRGLNASAATPVRHAPTSPFREQLRGVTVGLLTGGRSPLAASPSAATHKETQVGGRPDGDLEKIAEDAPQGRSDPNRDARGREKDRDDAPHDVAQPEPPWCDPTTRNLLQWGNNALPAPASHTPPPSAQAAVLDQLAIQFLRRASVGAQTVRLELGKGDFDGSEVLITTGEHGLDVSIQAPPGINGLGLRDAIEKRLAGRGLRVSRVTVE